MSLFRTSVKSEIEVRTIKDGLGSEIDVLHRGYFIANEEQLWQKTLLGIANSGRATDGNFILQASAVASLLYYRAVKSDWKDLIDVAVAPEDILEGKKYKADDLIQQAPSSQIISNLYDYFENERNCWKAKEVLLEVRGLDAYNACSLWARDYGNGCCVSTRSELKQQGLWAVFKTAEIARLAGYEVNMDDIYGSPDYEEIESTTSSNGTGFAPKKTSLLKA